MPAPTVTPRERFSRHWPGIAFVLLLVIAWLVFQSTNRVETNWQRSTRRLDEVALQASSGMLINAKTGRVEIGDEPGTLEWSEQAMEGLQFLQLQVKTGK